MHSSYVVHGSPPLFLLTKREYDNRRFLSGVSRHDELHILPDRMPASGSTGALLRLCIVTMERSAISGQGGEKNYSPTKSLRQDSLFQILTDLVYLLSIMQDISIHHKVAHLLIIMLHQPNSALERNSNLRLTNKCSRISLIL